MIKEDYYDGLMAEWYDDWLSQRQDDIATFYQGEVLTQSWMDSFDLRWYCPLQIMALLKEAGFSRIDFLPTAAPDREDMSFVFKASR